MSTYKRFLASPISAEFVAFLVIAIFPFLHAALDKNYSLAISPQLALCVLGVFLIRSLNLVLVARGMGEKSILVVGLSLLLVRGFISDFSSLSLSDVMFAIGEYHLFLWAVLLGREARAKRDLDAKREIERSLAS